MSTSGIIVNDYQNRPNIFLVQTYTAEDLIVVYDGCCASNTPHFLGVHDGSGWRQTITLGGRPRYGAKQAVGGVKGTNGYASSDVYLFVKDTFTLGQSEQQAHWNTTGLGEYTLLPFDWAVQNSAFLNVRDGIQQGDGSQTPLQFLYQAADCRFFYTAEMTVNMTAI